MPTRHVTWLKVNILAYLIKVTAHQDIQPNGEIPPFYTSTDHGYRSDVLLGPMLEIPFDALKEKILAFHRRTDETVPPRMLQLTGCDSVEGDLWQQAFIKRLPFNIQSALVPKLPSRSLFIHAGKNSRTDRRYNLNGRDLRSTHAQPK